MINIAGYIKNLLGLASRSFINLIIILIISRTVNLDHLGEFLYSLSFSMTLVLICDYGFNIKIPINMQEPHWREKFISAFYLKVCLALIISIFLLIYLSLGFYPYSEEMLCGIYFSVLINSFFNFFILLYRGRGEYGIESKWIFFNNFLLLILIGICVYKKYTDSIEYFYLFSRALSIFLLLLVFYNKKAIRFSVIKFKKIRDEAVEGFSYAKVMVLGVLYVSLDTIVMGYYSSKSDVAIYQILMQITLAMCITANAIGQVYSIEYKKLIYDKNDRSVAKELLKSIIVFSAVGFISGITFYLFSPIAIKYLFKINDKINLSVLFVFSLILLLRHMISALGSFITASNNNKYRNNATFCGIIVLLTILFLLNNKITIFYTALSSLVSHFVILILLIMYTIFIRKKNETCF